MLSSQTWGREYLFYAEPRPYNLPRKKVTFIKSLIAPSIDGRYSKATSYKSDTPISGGAYQDTRKVITEWNARLKHRGSPEFRCRMPPRIPTHSFLPHLFSCERKDGAAGGVGSRKSAKTSQALRASSPFRGAFSAAAGHKNFPAAGLSCGGVFLYPIKPTALRQTK